MQKVSARGLAEIAAHEGIVDAPYFDSAGVLTLGIGHTASAGPPDPAKNRRIYAISEIMDIFARDIAKFEARVRKAFTRPLTQAQFDAAVSFDFNTGGIDRATWVKQFNAGNISAARASFMNWRKPAEIIPRRQKERALFFDGKYSSDGYATVYPANQSGQVLWARGQRINVMDLMDRPIPPAPPADKPRTVPPSVALPTQETAPEASGGGRKGILAAVVLALAATAAWFSKGICELTGFFCGG